MILRRTYIDTPLAINRIVPLTDETFHYLFRVLRCRDGDKLIAFNGDGNDYLSELRQSTRKTAELHILQCQVNGNESPLQTTLLQGLCKGERMDNALQKAVELGVKHIYPVITDYCAVKLDTTRQQKKHRHWQAIITASCAQSERAIVPTLQPIQPLADALHKLPKGYGWVLHARNTDTPMAPYPAQLDKLHILIGPEGGLSANDLRLAQKANLHRLTLGKRILRTETATVTALSLAQYLWGDYHVK